LRCTAVFNTENNRGENMENKVYDLAVLGHYTKDTIKINNVTKHVDGGAVNYGAHMAARLGLKVAAITRLAAEDNHTVRQLEKAGVEVYVTHTPQSTTLVLEYPTNNLDRRIIHFQSSAGPFTVDEVKDINSRVFAIGPSIRGEVPLEVVEKIREKDTMISLDVQGYVRVVENNILVDREWPDIKKYLALVDVLKTDAVEAQGLTGETDIRRAARILAGFGPKEVVLTHRKGILVYDGRTYYEAVFYPKQLVGRSGRGDTVISTYMARRLHNAPREALNWAAAAASLKMEAEGPFKGSKEEIEDLLARKYK